MSSSCRCMPRCPAHAHHFQSCLSLKISNRRGLSQREERASETAAGKIAGGGIGKFRPGSRETPWDTTSKALACPAGTHGGRLGSAMECSAEEAPTRPAGALGGGPGSAAERSTGETPTRPDPFLEKEWEAPQNTVRERQVASGVGRNGPSATDPAHWQGTSKEG